jgi:hypothetical protein
VLVTLLLSNVITNETLPIVLDRSLGGGWPAVLSSTVLIGRYSFSNDYNGCIAADHIKSHFWRNRTAVSLCSLWPTYRSLDVALCVISNVGNVPYRLANR